MKTAKEIAQYFRESVSFDFSETITSFSQIEERQDTFFVFLNRVAFKALIEDFLLESDERILSDLFVRSFGSDFGFCKFAEIESRKKSKLILNAYKDYIMSYDSTTVETVVNSWCLFFDGKEIHSSQQERIKVSIHKGILKEKRKRNKRKNRSAREQGEENKKDCTDAQETRKFNEATKNAKKKVAKISKGNGNKVLCVRGKNKNRFVYSCYKQSAHVFSIDFSNLLGELDETKNITTREYAITWALWHNIADYSEENVVEKTETTVEEKTEGSDVGFSTSTSIAALNGKLNSNRGNTFKTTITTVVRRQGPAPKTVPAVSKEMRKKNARAIYITNVDNECSEHDDFETTLEILLNLHKSCSELYSKFLLFLEISNNMSEDNIKNMCNKLNHCKVINI